MSAVHFIEGFYRRITCSICGRKGEWPLVAFGDLAPAISARPEDCAALFVKNIADRKRDISLKPEVINHRQFNAKTPGVEYEIACPRCYRLGETPEANGVGKALAPWATLADMKRVFNYRIPCFDLTTTDFELMLKRVQRKAIPTIPGKTSFSNVSGDKRRVDLTLGFNDLPPDDNDEFELRGLWFKFTYKDDDYGNRFFMESQLKYKSDFPSPWRLNTPDELRLETIEIVFRMAHQLYVELKKFMPNKNGETPSLVDRLVDFGDFEAP